jgi:hypothetical protein
VSAATNVSCGATCDANVPIFLFDGTEVAASTDDLFAGAIMNLIDEDPNGNSSGYGAYVWTGSTSAGAGWSSNQMGTSTPVTGWDYYTSDMLSTGFLYADTTSLPIYALSGVLSAAVAAPEPASLSFLALGGVATGLVRRLRRKPPATP